MKNFFPIAIITLFVTTFSLFLGWVPIGALIPQALFVIASLAMCSKAYGSKSMVLLYIYFAYQYFSALFYGQVGELVTWVSLFFSMAIPIVISTALFSQKDNGPYKSFSKYAIIVSFVTILLSIRVLINDGMALRVTSMANSTGDWETLYGYWKQGMADYAMAAMMMFMPVVLVYLFKKTNKRREKNLALLGIVLAIMFMYLGQVTTTFIFCLFVTLLSTVRSKNVTFTYIGIALLAVFIVTQLSGLLDLAVKYTGDSSMNDRFLSMSGAISGEELDDSSDAGIRMTLLNRTLSTFFSNPILGNPTALRGGHNYFLDCLAKYGIIGCLPFFLLLKHQYKIISSRLSKEARQYYMIIFLVFILYGILKNLSGTEYWNYLFIYYPAILVWIDSRTQPSSIK